MTKKNLIKQAEAKPLLLKGYTLQQTAKETGLSLAQIKVYKKEIKQEFLELLKAGKQPEIVESILIEYLGVIEKAKEDLEQLKTETKQDNTRLQAINSLVKIAESKISTLQSLCLIPKPQEQKIEITQQYNLISIEEYLKKRGE